MSLGADLDRVDVLWLVRGELDRQEQRRAVVTPALESPVVTHVEHHIAALLVVDGHSPGRRGPGVLLLLGEQVLVVRRQFVEETAQVNVLAVLGPAQAKGRPQALGPRTRQFAEHRVGLRVLVVNLPHGGWKQVDQIGRDAGSAQRTAEVVFLIRIQRVAEGEHADHPAQRAVIFRGETQFLAVLLVPVGDVHREIVDRADVRIEHLGIARASESTYRCQRGAAQIDIERQPASECGDLFILWIAVDVVPAQSRRVFVSEHVRAVGIEADMVVPEIVARVIATLHRQQGGDPAVVLPLQLAAQRIVAVAIDVAAGCKIELRPVPPVEHSRQPARKRIGKRTSRARLDPRGVEASVRNARIRLELFSGLPGDEFDRAACRVATIQGALGAAKHFDPIKIEGGHQQRRQAAQIHIVLIKRDGVLGGGVEIVGSHAAHEDLRLGITGLFLDVEVRRLARQVAGVGYSGLAQLIRTERRHRDGHVLRPFRPPLGRDDDFLECRAGVGGFGTGLRERRARGAGANREHGEPTDPAGFIHYRFSF